MSSRADAKAMRDDDEEKTSTPKLRFPEFRNGGAWTRKKLDTVLRFQPGYPFPSAEFNEDGVGLRLIRNRDLRSDDKVIFYSGSFDEEFVR
jgi:type I restriction enzyme, S subunit